MTRYGWDASHYDWSDGDLHLGQAHADGIDLFTYKATEGNGYTDPVLSSTMLAARGVGFPVLGTYHFLLRSDRASIQSQVLHYIAKLNEFAPWRHEHPCWIYQVDAEKDSQGRYPSLADINAFADGVHSIEGCPASAIPIYAPKWLYGDGLAGLRYRTLWQSSYVDGAGGFKQLYPGDTSTKWSAYSGITPTILQYSSSAVIAGKTTCDANAVRVSTVADLQNLFRPGGHGSSGGGTELDDMTDEEHQMLADIKNALVADAPLQDRARVAATQATNAAKDAAAARAALEANAPLRMDVDGIQAALAPDAALRVNAFKAAQGVAALQSAQVDPAAFAAAVWAAAPAPTESGGGLTQQQLEDALRVVFADAGSP